MSRLAAETRRASKWQALSTRDAVVEALVVTYLAAMAAARAEHRWIVCPPSLSWRARRSFVNLPEAATRGEARSCGAQEQSVASAFHVIHISFSDELITPNERARLDTDLCRPVHVMRMESSRKRLGWRGRPDDGGRLSRFLPLTRAAEVFIRFSWSRPAQSTPGRVFPVSVPSVVQCPASCR